MKSRAQFKNHPLHPALVAFPIAFLYGCLVGDLAGRSLGRPAFWTVGAYLSVAAVASGLVAAVPGLVDYLYVVPPDSSAKRRATWHLGVNLTALALVALGWPLRDWGTLRPTVLTVVLELGGVTLVTWGGWIGAILVYRNQIGVDHRFAHAGKWQELSIEGAPGEMVTIDGAGAMKAGQMRLLRWTSTSSVESRGQRLVLARTEQGFALFDDHCTHRGGSLAHGVLIFGTVQCPLPGSQFHLHDRAGKAR